MPIFMHKMNRFILSVNLNLLNPKPRELIYLSNLIYVANSCDKHNFTYIHQNQSRTTIDSVSCRIHNLRILGNLSKENAVVPNDLSSIIRDYKYW